MIPSKAFFLFLGVGVVAGLVQPPVGVFLAALVVLGAIACMGRALIKRDESPRLERCAAALLGLAIGAVATYLIARTDGAAPWAVLALVLLLDAALIWALLRFGRTLGSPIVRWRQKANRRPHEFGIVMILAVALALAASFETGADDMPGVALGSPLVLYVERAAALFGVLLLVFTIVVYAWRGVLPTQISSRGVGYAEAKDKTEESLDELRDASRSSTKALRQTRKEIKELSKRLGTLEQ